jgi:hypothetical protein
MNPANSTARCRAAVVLITLGAGLVAAWPACAALGSGSYRTLPGATVEEQGDGVAGGSRVLALSATLTFDLHGSEPVLVAVIRDAVLEGGEPFELTVRSSSGFELADGTYRFTGDYLGEIEPSGTQYLFDWRFSTSTNGEIVWDGITGWAGGHIWQVTLAGVTLLPAARLQIAPAGSGLVQIAWATRFSDHVLEYATGLPAPGWSAVTNAVSNEGDRFSVTPDAGGSPRFYRLRQR